MSPKSPKRLSLKPTHIGWFDLPLEMRDIVIDFMDPKTRCRFSQCSKLCENEAKKSKLYLNKIGLLQNNDNDDRMELHINHGDSPRPDYCLEFVDARNKQTIVVYRCYKPSDSRIVAKWTELENGEPKDVRLKYFNTYLKKYNHSIRSFVFNDETMSVLEVDIENLKNLEQLELKNYTDDAETLLENGFIEQNQIMRFKHLDMPSMYFKLDQILDFKGETLICTSEDIDEKLINKLLKKLKSGESLENLKHIRIFIGNMDEKVDNIYMIVEGLNVKTEYARQYLEHCQARTSRIVGCHLFYLSSEIRKNGRFLATFVPQRMLEINWITTL